MNIAVIGAGTGGTKLINLFHEYPGLNVISVVDKNMQSPGILRAKELGIHVTTDINDISTKAETIVEATGSHKVLEMIKEHFGDSKRIIESDVAQLMMGIVDKQIDTANRLNLQLEKINKTSEKLHQEMNKIVEVTDDLNKINTILVNSSNESKKFIEKTDEMIRAVNKITQQIKILGLNANIEAARAGEHGRGFSVVANEVQKMSSNTSEFAGQISDLLSALSLENENIANEVMRLNDISTSQHEITHKAKGIVDELKNL